MANSMFGPGIDGLLTGAIDLDTAAIKRSRRLAAAGARGTGAGAGGNTGSFGRSGSVILRVSDQHGRAGVAGPGMRDDRGVRNVRSQSEAAPRWQGSEES